MSEIGIDISKNQAKKVFDFYRQDRLYKYVVPVCEEAAEQCPSFAKVLHWSFENPEAFTGTYQERLAEARTLRDQIRKKVEQFIAEH